MSKPVSLRRDGAPGTGGDDDTGVGINPAAIASDLVPDADGTRDVGSVTNRWRHVIADKVFVGAVPIETDGADVLNQRRGTNAQTLRVANTWTDASNNEFFAVKWNGNVCDIGTFHNGTGAARTMRVFGGNTLYAQFGSSQMTVYQGARLSGTVKLPSLPTSDPASAGQLWNDGGTVKVSAG